MALYRDCDDSGSLMCFSSENSDDQQLLINSKCLFSNTKYYIRVWSGGSATEFSGTLRIGTFAWNNLEVVLLKETFDGGMAGWHTHGRCAIPDSNAHAEWRWSSDGMLDKGAYVTKGFAINSPSICDGAVGVDADFDDNAGIDGNFGGGPCPAPAQYILESPKWRHDGWGVAGIAIIWTQALRQFRSTYFVSFRIYDDGAWQAWKDFQVNEEFELNASAVNQNVQRHFIEGAHQGDSLQVRFIYNANYYMWSLDDIYLVEMPCVDLRSVSNFYAIAPAARFPADQVVTFWPLNNIYNAGACAQSDVVLNFTLKNSHGQELYNEDLNYGDVQVDTVIDDKYFELPVTIPEYLRADTYSGTYTLTSPDATPDGDHDFSDNTNTFSFSTTDGQYSLETGYTRSFAPWIPYVPNGTAAYVFGAYYYFSHGSEYKLTSVTWGANNPADIAGIPIVLKLFKWTDVNDNAVAEAFERELVASSEIVFDGSESDYSIFEAVLEPVNDPGSDVWLEDQTAYLMVMEYRAVDFTYFFMLASDEFDYSAVMLSSRQAGVPTYSSVFGIKSPGVVDGIDYTLHDPITEDFKLVPMMRLNTARASSVKELPDEERIRVYPNPASKQVQVALQFSQVFRDVKLILIECVRQVSHGVGVSCN